ncbi:disulfide bond formation protein B [Mesorhizobium sp. NBSH29]|uniref:disulfide bond formation protein B n=1 Tax=Mesorhizobium sp. NBSH29 TaxID=2654249 RepID=UPI00189681F9|nr:disulfide bond formation protein B [Mesorhizobium sp. NBSH29]QPC85634.1 disulfide bond formation protein B [Mesorhizobium sp. NBSH29]
MTAFNAPIGRNQIQGAVFLALAMAAVVGGALAFEHLGGYMPCKLCLEQRTPYYVGAPLMLLAALSATLRIPAPLTRGLLLFGAGLMAYGLYLAVFHSGVEWGWWPGPSDCGAVTSAATGGNGVLDVLNTIIPPSCDTAALRFLGLSMAGWNAIASLILMGVAVRAAFLRG